MKYYEELPTLKKRGRKSKNSYKRMCKECTIFYNTEMPNSKYCPKCRSRRMSISPKGKRPDYITIKIKKLRGII